MQGILLLANLGPKDVRGNTTNDQTSTRKLVRDSESAVDKKPQFEFDLRVEGVSQDAILQDDEKMKETNKNWKSSKLDHAQNLFVTICRKVIQGVSFDWGCLYYNWGILSKNPGQSNTPNRLKAEKWPKLQREAKKCVFMTQTAARIKKSARSITIVTQT